MEAEGFVVVIVGCAAGSVGLVGALGALKGFEGPKYSAIWSLKWILSFLKRIDLRSVGSAIISKLNSINLTNSFEFVGAKKCQGANMYHRSGRRDS